MPKSKSSENRRKSKVRKKNNKESGQQRTHEILSDEASFDRDTNLQKQGQSESDKMRKFEKETKGLRCTPPPSLYKPPGEIGLADGEIDIPLVEGATIDATGKEEEEREQARQTDMESLYATAAAAFFFVVSCFVFIVPWQFTDLKPWLKAGIWAGGACLLVLAAWAWGLPFSKKKDS